MSVVTTAETGFGASRFAQRLAREVAGDVRFDRASRARYATDASIYQIMPLGVVLPRSVEDVMATLALAREAGVPVLPRGAGTSQCGQTVNRALVLDCSKYLRRILAIDASGRTATVEPGVVLAELNNALRPMGLFFPVDPSTHNRCTIGGMAGNNSCGAKSIRYGLMADNVNAIDAVLIDGNRYRFGPLPLPEMPHEPFATLISRLLALGKAEAEEIAARFPRLLRRVGGYNIDALTPDAIAKGRASLARLLVGSEGTLAFSAAIELKLSPIKPRKVLGICQFPSFRSAMEAVKDLVNLDPEAVELVDRTMIDLARAIPIYSATVDQIVREGTDCLLIVEFHGDADAPLTASLSRLEEMMADLGHPHAVVRVTDAARQAEIAELREAGLNIMMSMKGDGKPVSFIEDAAVALSDLADYTERLNAVFQRHGVKGTWYAHASVGCLHVRPVLNMKDPADVAKMRAIAEECFALVRAYKGSHSGEHGDGIVRSEFHEQMFGPRIVRTFEHVKEIFDPLALLNPGRIVRAPRMDDRALFRYPPGYGPDPSFRPKLNWSEHPGGMLGAVEMCNNNGTCRKFDSGVMCPSFRATREETHLTRGRANLLRFALTGQLGAEGIRSPALVEALSLCVSCKACKRECPTGVDMAKMKIEVLAAQAEENGIAAGMRLVAELPRLAPFAARFPKALNLRNRLSLLRRFSKRLGFAPERALPEWRKDVFRDTEAKNHAPSAKREVLLFADTFNRYFEPENLRATLAVLAAAGIRAKLPLVHGRPLCCGRTYLAAGQVERARAEARRTLAALAGPLPVIGIEPSCLLTLRDEFLSLLPRDQAGELASRAFLLSEYLEREQISLPLRPLRQTAYVHGHCHQKAFGAFPAALALLRRVPELAVNPITATCCGMAGAFGYQAETQSISRAMAEAGLLPALRAAPAEALAVADGTSCRHQIRDLAGRKAMHSVQVLAMALAFPAAAIPP